MSLKHIKCNVGNNSLNLRFKYLFLIKSTIYIICCPVKYIFQKVNGTVLDM